MGKNTRASEKNTRASFSETFILVTKCFISQLPVGFTSPEVHRGDRGGMGHNNLESRGSTREIRIFDLPYSCVRIILNELINELVEVILSLIAIDTLSP